MAEIRPAIAARLLTLPETFPGAIYSLHELLGAVGRTWTQITGKPESPSRRFSSSSTRLA